MRNLAAQAKSGAYHYSYRLYNILFPHELVCCFVISYLNESTKGMVSGTMTSPSMGMLQWEDLSLLWTKFPAKTTHQLHKMLIKQKNHLALEGKVLIHSYFMLRIFSFFLNDIDSYCVCLTQGHDWNRRAGVLDTPSERFLS
jgi:hypothetical protein